MLITVVVLWHLPAISPMSAQPGVREEHLLESDLDLIVDQGGSETIATSSSQNQTCLLTPVTTDSQEAGGCTWREENVCTRIPTVKRMAVYQPGCQDGGTGTHLTDCQVMRRGNRG